MITKATTEIILPISSTLQWNYDVFPASAPVRNRPADWLVPELSEFVRNPDGEFLRD